MAWSYHKRIKIIPGVHLNLSKGGISTSIGVKGASLNIGKSGTYLNTSIPLLGIRNKVQLSGSNHPTVPFNYLTPTPLEENVFSADIHEITSQNMQGLKEAIMLYRIQRSELDKDITKIRQILFSSKLKLGISYVLLYGIINKSIAQRIKADILLQHQTISKIQEQKEHSKVSVNIEVDPEINKKYCQVLDAFKQLMTSEKIWDVTGTHYQDRVAARSSASTLVSRKEVRFNIRALSDINADVEVLYFQNANGADLYFYPAFIVMQTSKEDLAVIGMDEVSIHYTPIRFTEESTVPRDTEVIDRTWAKVNKNGTPDKRFKGNYQIPVVRYGELSLTTTSGLNERYQCSNFEAVEIFWATFNRFQQVIKGIK